MRLDTTGAGTLAEGGLPDASATALEPARQAPPASPAALPGPWAERAKRLLERARSFRHARLVAFGIVALSVLAFSWGWPGRLVLDGPGVALWLRLAVDHLQHGGGLPYWMPEMWAGSPAWALAPSFPTLILAPFAMLIGAEQTVKMATLAAQVVGGWGAFMLAQALWDRRSTMLPLAVALLYALHPLVVSHGALFGHETSLWVIAVTPWLAWTVRQAFRENGRRWAVASGLLAAFAILHQAEHAYGLVLMCGCQLAIELGHARHKPGAARRVLGQTVTISTVAGGAVAFWLVPFLVMSKSFVLTPPEIVRSVLQDGIASILGNEPGTFLTRAHAVSGTVTFDRDLLRGNVYLSWVCLVPSFFTALLISRHDDDGHLTAILLAGGVGVWLSTAATPLADSGPAQRLELVPFLVIGSLTGLVVGSCLRRMTSGRAAALLGAAAGMSLLVVPYLTPFLALQRVIPLLDTIRFPRFYPVAALGVALGAVYPIRVLGQWAARHRPAIAPALTAAATLLLLAAFLVDIHPYRSFYRVRPPDGDAAYRQAADNLAAVGSDFRVATAQFGDPRLSSSLLESGFELSVGWPHPIAARDAWRLTGEAIIGPPFYREKALGLSATAYMANEQITDTGGGNQHVTGMQLVRNPWALPLVRAYDEAVVVRDSSIAPELAVSLAQHNVAVVAGGPEQSRALGDLRQTVVSAADACGDREVSTGPVADEVAKACALHRWVGVFAAYDILGVGGNLGGVFHSPADGLRGVSVWLDRPPGDTVLSLHELGSGGELGPEIAQATSSTYDWDDNGLYAFRFDPIADSAGHRYAFILSCPKCAPTDEPRLVATQAPRGSGTLTKGGKLLSDRGAAFSLLYEDMPNAEPSRADLHATELGPGRWRVGVSGDHQTLLVVAEAYFPGWQAKVDGRPAPVMEADGAFLGVSVPPGDHTVELTFHPPAARTIGRLITAATLLAVMFAGPISRRRTRTGARRR